MCDTFAISALALRDVGLRDTDDAEIFAAAAMERDIVVMTKDVDFVQLLERHGAPPKVIWITCGNTSNSRMQEILSQTLQSALQLLTEGNSLVEITDL